MRTTTFVLSLCLLLCATGCSFIDDFGSFTVATGDASTSDLGVDGGVPSDLGPDAFVVDLGEPDLGAPDAGPIGHVVDLVAGSGYTCALYDTGRLRCWGSNFYGNLGNGAAGPTGDAVAEPQDVIGLPGPVTQIAAGYDHICALIPLMGTNALYCWGNGFDGQFGTGSTEQFNSTPQRIGAIGSVRGVAAGGHFTCIIDDTSSEVRCAGSNAYQALGSPNPPASSLAFLPTMSSLASRDSTAIVAGWANACVLSGGSAYCWGDGRSNQLATPATDDSADALLVGPAARITIGTSHMCALAADGDVSCWGYGYYGQLGNATRDDQSTPLAVMGPVGSGSPLTALAVVAAGEHTCAIVDDVTGGDDVYCWGKNGAAELGVSTATEYLTRPRKVDGIDGVTRLASGPDHVCALTTAGEVYCWGSNYWLSLGPGAPADFGNSPTPVRVTGL